MVQGGRAAEATGHRSLEWGWHSHAAQMPSWLAVVTVALSPWLELHPHFPYPPLELGRCVCACMCVCVCLCMHSCVCAAGGPGWFVPSVLLHLVPSTPLRPAPCPKLPSLSSLAVAVKPIRSNYGGERVPERDPAETTSSAPAQPWWPWSSGPRPGSALLAEGKPTTTATSPAPEPQVSECASLRLQLPHILQHPWGPSLGAGFRLSLWLPGLGSGYTSPGSILGKEGPCRTTNLSSTH